MTNGSELLTNVFLYTFLFGLVFTVVSVLLGVTHIGGDLSGNNGHLGHGGNGAHMHLHHDVHVHGDAEAEGPGILNMPTIMAFLTWFGGAGYILSRTLGLGGLLSIPLALLSGIVGGGIMFVVLARLLWPLMSRPLDRADYRLPGTAARVVSAIREGGTGEIVYMKNGSRFTAGARVAGSDLAVPRGAEVVIINYERGIAYVQPVDRILAGNSGEVKQA